MEWINPVDVWLTQDQMLNNAQLVANHFLATNWTPQAISSLCGNMSHESSINPNIWEYGYNHSLDRGYGLVQWTPASKYIDWANMNSLDYTNGDSQLSRIDYEQQNGIQWISTNEFPMSFNDFTKSTETVDYLTEAFMNNYERPNATAGQESLQGRIDFANLCLQTLNWNGTITPPQTSNDSNKIIHLLLCDALNGWKW
jgi:hypothetical protein